MKLKDAIISALLTIAAAQVSASGKDGESATSISPDAQSFSALTVNNEKDNSVRSHVSECLRQLKDCMADPGIDDDLCGQMYIEDCLFNP